MQIIDDISKANGRDFSSQRFDELDKPTMVKSDKIGDAFGHLDNASMISVNGSLALVLGLAR